MNFLRYRVIHILLMLSIFIVVVCSLLFSSINYGVDFNGGVIINVKGNVDEFLEKGFNAVQNGEYVSIKSNDQSIVNSFDDIESKRIIGAKSINAIQQLIKAVFVALLMMMLYIWYRFKFSFSICAITALVCDSSVIIGYLIFSGMEINENAIVALLTTISYSINDTVVIFDRIREKQVQRSNHWNEIINVSINSTFTRTLYTSITTALSLLVLVLFGGPVISSFAMPILVGVIAGTYSSIFVVPSLLSFLRV